MLKSLNGDRGYGITLVCVLLLLLAPELDGQAARDAMSYQRALLSDGKWWRVLSAHFVLLDF